MTETRQLIISFPDQSPSFAYGFEAGGVWHRMRTNEPDIGTLEEPLTLREENKELYSDMAQNNLYHAYFRPSEVEGWMYVYFTKKKTGLQLVTGGTDGA